MANNMGRKCRWDFQKGGVNKRRNFSSGKKTKRLRGDARGESDKKKAGKQDIQIERMVKSREEKMLKN